jgi:hypothetical protein
MWRLLWALVPVVAHADMSECINIADQNKKNYCMASYSGSAAFCDKIRSYESRTSMHENGSGCTASKCIPNPQTTPKGRNKMNLQPAAVDKLKELVAEEGNPELKLRVFVQGGGCSGFSYGFTFDEAKNEDDFDFHL